MTQFASATFTGANDSTIQAGDANWVKSTGFTADGVITNNRARCVAAGSNAGYYYNVAPPSADYSVSADFYVVATTSTTYTAWVAARQSSSAATRYAARWRNGTGWQLFKYVSGTATQLGSTVAASYSAGTTKRAKLVCNGSAISLYVDDVLTIGPITDTSITAAGYPGVVLSTESGTDGVHIDNWSADTLDTAATFSTTATTALPTASASASVSPVTSFAVTTGSLVFSGSASTGGAAFSFAPTTALPAFSGSATSSSAVAITITDLRDLTTGTLRTNETNITAIINNVSTGDLVAKLTGQTSTAGGDMTLTHASLVSGTQYRVTIIMADGSEGTWKYTAA